MTISSSTQHAETAVSQQVLPTTRYYTPREVAARLRVSPTTVMRAIHEDRLFAVRVSERVYRIPVGAFVRFERGETGLVTVPAVDVAQLSEPESREPVGSESAEPATVGR